MAFVQPPDTDRSGHVAVVTGAARGIGRAVAQRLAAGGMAVVLTARTGHRGDGAYAGSLDEAVADLHRSGYRAIGQIADLADPNYDRGELVRLAEATFGAPVDVVVHNAAAERRFDMTFEKMTADAFRETVEVNVWSGWDLAVKAYEGMQRRGAGWIVFISSGQAGPRVGPPYERHPTQGATLYGSTKAMIDRLVTGAASELVERNIAINALSPEGAVATENATAVTHGMVTAATAEPLETMAEAALALCSGDPQVRTGMVAYSLSLLKALNRPVRTLDGTELVVGWQPDDIDRARLRRHYLSSFATPNLPQPAIRMG